MKRAVGIFLVMAMTMGLAGCGSQAEGTAAPAAAEAAETAAETAEAAAGDTAKADDDQIIIGFANIAEQVELQIQVRESIEKAAEEAGVKLITADNNYDGAKAVEIADNMISQGIDGFIEFNLDESVGPVIMEKMNDAGIPVIAVDIAMDGATFFGADNVTAGKVAGARLGEVAKERWGEEPDCLLLVEDSTSGETALQRTECTPDGLKEVFPDFSEDKIIRLDSGTDASSAQKTVSDFLSAHPTYNKIAINTFNDVIATSTLAAIETAGREADCIMVSENEYGYLDYIKTTSQAPENEVWVGGVAFFFNRYGEYTVPAIISLIKGETVDESIYVDHAVITRDNAEEWFADYLAE
ncbi:MAG: sugar ABC transporter substrate-binding protein [Lachnospiraceae bacterium]